MAIDKNKKKILYIAQEIAPFVEEHLVDEGSNLFPLGMLERGHDIRTFMPDYGVINERRNQLHEVIRLSGVNLTVNDKVHQLVVKVASLMPQRLQIYFVDNDDFFARKGTVVDQEGRLYDDNVERAVFFIRGVFETIKKLRWIPDVIHCQGWFSGLAPLYLRTMLKDDPALSNAKIVYSFHDISPATPFGPQLTEVLAFDGIKHKLLDGKALTKEQLLELIMSQSDGLIIASNEMGDEVRKWISASGLKTFEYTERNDEVMDAVDRFYEEL